MLVMVCAGDGLCRRWTVLVMVCAGDGLCLIKLQASMVGIVYSCLS